MFKNGGPGGCCCGGTPGTGVCPGCGGTFANVLKATIPSLSLVNVPLTLTGAGASLWISACTPVTLLGYAACGKPPCSNPALTLATITSACLISLECRSGPIWHMQVLFPSCNSLVGSGGTVASCQPGVSDAYRAFDATCSGSAFVCPAWCSPGVGGTFAAVSDIAQTCTRPLSLSFPSFTVPLGTNYYVTSATISQ